MVLRHRFNYLFYVMVCSDTISDSVNEIAIKFTRIYHQLRRGLSNLNEKTKLKKKKTDSNLNKICRHRVFAYRIIVRRRITESNGNVESIVMCVPIT